MKKQLLGGTGVDSGQLLITDPCYVEMSGPNKGITYDDMICNGNDPKQIINKFGAEVGLVLPTLHGDGFYEVKGNYNKHGRITSITINLNY